VFQNVEELRCALAEFRERYNQRWIVQRLGYLTPAQAPAAPCTRSRGMNTLNSLSKKSGAKHGYKLRNEPNFRR